MLQVIENYRIYTGGVQLNPKFHPILKETYVNQMQDTPIYHISHTIYRHFFQAILSNHGNLFYSFQ